jgi:mannosyltransferase
VSTDAEGLLQAGMAPPVAEVQAPADLAVPGGVPRRRRGRAAWRRLPDWTLIAGPAVTLAMTVWGIGARSYWADEADTVSAVSRSVPQLIRLLGRVDAVHGLYYLLLWPVARVAGTGEFAMRFPSAVAMAAAAAGVTAIARRLAGRRAGLYAGLVFAVLPTVSLQGQDARPYAAVTAAAVLASYLLVRAAGDPRPRWLAGYGLSLMLVGYLQMFGLLLAAAHLVSLAGLAWRQRVVVGDRRWLARGWLARGWLGRGWLVTFAAVCVAMVPLLIIGWAQRAAIAWIPRPGWSAGADAVTSLAAGSVASVIVLGLLAVLGVFGGPRGGWLTQADPPDRAAAVGGGGRVLGWLAVPWLLLAPTALLAVSLIKPVYNGRYITYCLPAVALLAGCGLAALRQPVRAGALALVVALAAPPQLALRTPDGGIRAAAQFLSSHEQPGDAIIYPESLIPPWDLAYPGGFARLRDLSLWQTAAAAGRLYATTVPRPVLQRREQTARRIWAVQMGPGGDPAAYLAPGFRLAHEWTLRGYLTIWLYTKARPVGAPCLRGPRCDTAVRADTAEYRSAPRAHGFHRRRCLGSGAGRGTAGIRT